MKHPRTSDRFWPGVALTVLAIGVMFYLRMIVFPDRFVPLTDSLPLLLAFWHRSKRLLWLMVASFTAMLLFKLFWVMPQRVPDGIQRVFGFMQLLNILVPALVIHAVLELGARLTASVVQLERVNAELEATNEELAAREEEINQQNEELQSQTVELEQQVEELGTQSEELQVLNEQLAERERTLSDLLQPYVVGGGAEDEVLAHLGEKVVRLLGERAVGATLSEPDGHVMGVSSVFGVAEDYREVPRERTLAELVVARDRAALLDDVSLRSDLEFPGLASGRPVRSVIAAPLRTPDGGALEIYADSAEAWGEEDLRMAQWLAIQCGRLWNNARLRDDLERQRILLRTITDHAEAALLMCDAAGRCTYMNPAAERIAGLGAGQAVGRRLHDVLHGPHADHAAADCPLHAGPSTHPDVFVQPDATRVPVLCTVAPVHRDGKVTSIVVEARDMREARAHEVEREQLLARERAAREEAERAVRARDEFVATLSHELRTPLNAVLGWAMLLRQDLSDPEEIRNGVEVIERNARHQAQLISDLLDMSGIIAGKIALHLQPVDAAEVVRRAIETTRPMMQEKGVRVECDFDPAAARVLADPERLQQVVWNLLTNSVKFTPEGGLIRAALHNDANSVVIEIADTGQGIEPELLPHMFDRYRQVDGSSTRRHGGLGIGLAIVKHLVELHHGEVRLTSPGPGKGATCVVRLPAHAAVPALAREPGKPAPALQTHRPRLDGLAVLIVDDEEDARSLIARILRDTGAEPITASSAEEAFQHLCDARVDVLVSDIGMPGADGYSLMRRVRAECPEHVRDLPAIALTAFARSSDRTQALNAGFHAHVSKPVEPDELLATIASLRNTVLRYRRSDLADPV